MSQSRCQCGNSGCQAGEAPWTERTVATCWFSHVSVGVSNRRWGVLAGLQSGCESWLGQGSASDGWWGSSLSTGSPCSWVGWPGWGRFCRLLSRGVSLDRGEAGPGELLLAVDVCVCVGGGLLLGCDKASVASRTRGCLHPLRPLSFIVATCWFAGPFSFPQAVWRELGCLTVAGDLLLGAGWLGQGSASDGWWGSSLSTGSRCSWVGWPGWGRFCWRLGMGVLLVAVRPSREISCWQLVGAFEEGLQPLLYPLLILSDGRWRSVVEGSCVPTLAEMCVLSCLHPLKHIRGPGFLQHCLRRWHNSDNARA